MYTGIPSLNGYVANSEDLDEMLAAYNAALHQ